MKVSRDNLLNAAMMAPQKGLFEEAEDGYRKLLEAYQEDAQVLFQLGTLKYQTGAYEEAVKYLQYSLKIEPENIRALNSLGVSYFSLNDVPRAINTLEHAIRRKPNDIDLHVNKGNILKTIGRYEQALECFQSVLELD